MGKKMKIEHDGDWLKFIGETGFMESMIYFKPLGDSACLGLDDYCCEKLHISELKLLAKFLTEYVEKYDGNQND